MLIITLWISIEDFTYIYYCFIVLRSEHVDRGTEWEREQDIKMWKMNPRDTIKDTFIRPTKNKKFKYYFMIRYSLESIVV